MQSIVKNCTAEVAEKILNMLEGVGIKEPISEEATAEIKALLSSDEVTGKEVKEIQASKGFSVAMLVLGVVVMATSLHFVPIWMDES